MKRLIIHAGFPKCGSTTIFRALSDLLPFLRESNVYVINHAFRLQEGGAARLRGPLWEIAQARGDPEKGRLIERKLAYQIEHAPADSTVILSAEILHRPDVPAFFTRLPRRCAVKVIFYVRPEVEWIGAAWKQWELKHGTSLQEAAAAYLRLGLPGYLGSARAWQEALPDAQVVARPMAPAMLEGRDIVSDFLHQIGLHLPSDVPLKTAANRSIDFAMLHVLQTCADLAFEGRHDNKIFQTLERYLPAEYARNQTPLFNQDYAHKIFEHFRDDNIALATQFMGQSEPEAFVRAYFNKTDISESYMDMPEAQVLVRAQRILQDAAEQYPEMWEDVRLMPLFECITARAGGGVTHA